jgi:SOS-response transcriptional repressor LexA
MAQMIGLTKRQAELLGFLKRHFLRSSTAPTYSEIMVALGLASKASVHRLVLDLEERGYIRRAPGKARAIILEYVPVLERQAFNVVLPTDVEAELRRIAQETKMPPQRIIAEAVRSYIMDGL